MKKIFLSLFFMTALGLTGSAQTTTQEKKTTVNANVNSGKVSASKTTDQTTTHKKNITASSSGNGGVNMNSGNKQSTTKKHYGWKKGKHKGNMKPVQKQTTTKTTTTTTTNQ